MNDQELIAHLRAELRGFRAGYPRGGAGMSDQELIAHLRAELKAMTELHDRKHRDLA